MTKPLAEPARATSREARVAFFAANIAMLAPAAVAIFSIDLARDFAHDLAFLRVTGGAGTGIFRALDAIAVAPFLLVPLGTPVFRASIASAFFAALAGRATYAMARAALAPTFGPKWQGHALAFLGSITATLSAPWIFEATAPGGSTLGALLAILPLALVAHATTSEPNKVHHASFFASLGALIGVATFYEPILGLAGALSVVPYAGTKLFTRSAFRAYGPAFLASFAIGALPPAIALVRIRAGALSNVTALFASPQGEAAYAGAGTPNAFFRSDIGIVFAALVALGVFSLARKKETRVIGASLALLVSAGILGAFLGAPCEAPRFASCVLAALCASGVLAAVALGHLVDFVSRAEIPFARASASLIVVFEMALPARQADDALTRRDMHSPLATTLVDSAAWGALDTGAALVVSDPRSLSRVLAARENGELRSDLIVSPTFDLASRAAREALQIEPLLASVYRDVALGGRPEEFALSELAHARSLSLSFDPSWDRALARHLVSAGMSTVFEAEPRGASDRIARIESFGPLRQKIVVHVLPQGRDPERQHVVVHALRARAIALGSGGERAVLSKALDDLRAISPDDAIADKLTRRIVTAKGPIDVHDLTP